MAKKKIDIPKPGKKRRLQSLLDVTIKAGIWLASVEDATTLPSLTR